MNKRETSTKLKSHIITLLLFAIVAFSIYSNSINAQFCFDDSRNITENANVTITELSFESLKKAAFSSNAAGFRPVSYLSLAINYYYSRLDTTSYHVINIIIHIINAFLIYIILLRMLGLPPGGASRGDTKKTKSHAAIAFFTALIWLCHPLNSQAVILVVQRMALLMSMFFLLAFLFYMRWRSEKRIGSLVMTVMFFALSLLSKQNAAVFPGVIIIYELVFIRKGNLKNITKGEKIFAGVTALLSGAIFIMFKAEILKSFVKGYAMRDFTMYERILTQFRVLADYISLLLLPLPGRLSLTHDIIKSTSLITPITTLLSLIALVAMIVVAILRIKKTPRLSFAILWFFTLLTVESTIIPLEMKFDHRVYMPGIFLIGLFVEFIIINLYEKKRKAALAILCSTALLFGAMTVVRGDVWKKATTLWADVVAKYPDDARAHFNLGQTLATEKNYSEALKEYQIALDLDPENSIAIFGMGNIYREVASYKRAIEYFKLAAEKSDVGTTGHFKIIKNLGGGYFRSGQYKLAEETFKKFLPSYEANGEYLYNLGLTLQSQGKLSESLEWFQKALSRGYDAEKVYVDIVMTAIELKRTDTVVSFYNQNRVLFEQYCLGEYVRGLISEFQLDIESAKRFYNGYLKCGGTVANETVYKNDARRRLKLLLKR